MDDVVRDGAQPLSCCERDEREIRCERQREQQPPLIARVEVDRDRGAGDNESLGVQEKARKALYAAQA